MDEPAVQIDEAELGIVLDSLGRLVPGYEVWAFGSRVTGTNKRYSDLDLAILTTDLLPTRVAAALAHDFSESDLPFRVDLVDWAATSPAFRERIAAQKVVIQRPAFPLCSSSESNPAHHVGAVSRAGEQE